MHEANDVLISGPGTGAGRRSDEQHTSFTTCRDSDSGLDGETLMVTKGISKQSGMARTSVHQDGHYHYAGGYSGRLDSSGSSLSPS